MAFLDKIMFWKKKEEPIPEKPPGMDEGFDDDFSKPIGGEPNMEDPMDHEPMGLDHEAPGVPSKPEIPLTAPKTPTAPGAAGLDRDTELVLAKLDAIKARIESMDARLGHIEKLAEE